MSRAKMVDYYINRINAGDIEIIRVRQELEANQVREDEIRIIVRLIDNELQRTLRVKANNQSVNGLTWSGIVLAGLGIAVMAGTYTGVIRMGNYFVVPYGVILAGLSMTVSGLAKRRRVR